MFCRNTSFAYNYLWQSSMRSQNRSIYSFTLATSSIGYQHGYLHYSDHRSTIFTKTHKRLINFLTMKSRFITSGDRFCKNTASNRNETNNSQAVEENEALIKIEYIDPFHIMIIQMNRHEKRNCVNKEMARQLLDAFYAFEVNENMHCAVLYGIGGNFSAGYDLEELASIEEADLANYIASIMMERGPMGPTRMQITKPVIAAIEGWCVAGGLELALMADLRVADSCSRLGFLNRRFGVPLLDGGSVRLPHLIGLSRAMDLILTGRIIDANEAHIMGLVNIVTKTGTAYGRAIELAKQITVHPQLCLKTDRSSTLRSMFNLHLFADNLRDSLENEGTQGMTVISKESIEGAKKFVSGMGKHGKFNVNNFAEKQEWEKEFDGMMKNKTK